MKTTRKQIEEYVDLEWRDNFTSEISTLIIDELCKEFKVYIKKPLFDKGEEEKPQDLGKI